MANYGMLRNYRFTDEAEDIRGSKLYGLEDEKLGKIDDVIFDHTTGLIRYVVVDTGGWLSTKQFIVPADRLRPSTQHDDDFTVDLTKAQVENFPPYKETDRNITPTTQQMPETPVSTRVGTPEAETAEIADTEFIEPGYAAGTSTVEIDNTAVGIGPRWDTFQDRLRERRKEVINTGRTRADEYRKAS